MPRDELRSSRPSERLFAANLLLTTGQASDRGRIQDALLSESVPRIRAVLQAALAALDRSPGEAGTVDDRNVSGAPDLQAVLQNLSGMIQHELSAATGWIEYTASKALLNYEETEVKRAIGALKQRVNGLVAIVQANKSPRMTSSSLAEVVANSIPPEFPASAGVFDGQSDDDQIVTDQDLLSLILINAMQNAYESAAQTGRAESLVHVTYGVSQTDFWISISNPYIGAPFSVEDVQATGVSSKHDHRGIGLRVMLTASSALGYDLGLMGTGQVADFRLRGPRIRHA